MGWITMVSSQDESGGSDQGDAREGHDGRGGGWRGGWFRGGWFRGGWFRGGWFRGLAVVGSPAWRAIRARARAARDISKVVSRARHILAANLYSGISIAANVDVLSQGRGDQGRGEANERKYVEFHRTDVLRNSIETGSVRKTAAREPEVERSGEAAGGCSSEVPPRWKELVSPLPVNTCANRLDGGKSSYLGFKDRTLNNNCRRGARD